MRHMAEATAIRDKVGAPLNDRRRKLHRALSAWGLRELGPEEFQRLWGAAVERT